jgi:hypothetical protein
LPPPPEVATTKICNYHDEIKIALEGKELEDVEKFVHLGSILTKNGGSNEDVESQIR